MTGLDLETVYRPVEKSVVAEALSLYGVEAAVEASASPWYSLSDRSVRCVVYEWLDVVAKHLDFDACVIAAVAALS